MRIFLLLFCFFFYDRGVTSEPITPQPLFEDDNLNHLSAQEISLLKYDFNDDIEKKVFSAITEVSSNCSVYKPIKLSIDKFLFPKASITIDLGVANASFYNFTFKEESQTNYVKNEYITTVGCDSSGLVKIAASIPNDIRISANVKLMSSNGFIVEPKNEGSISVVLRNNSISKQDIIQINSAQKKEDIFSKLSYFQSEVLLNIDTIFHMPIYSRLEYLFEKIESSLSQYLSNELDTELANRNILMGNTCPSITRNPTEFSKNFHSSNHSVYIIPNAQLETWKETVLSAGPIVIDGLTSFNNTELIISDNEVSSANEFEYHDTTTWYERHRYRRWGSSYLRSSRPSSYYWDYEHPSTSPRPISKYRSSAGDFNKYDKLTVRIKTNSVKGKFEWSYNSNSRSYNFHLDYILFEFDRKTGSGNRRSDDFRRTSARPYTRSYYYYYDDEPRSSSTPKTTFENDNIAVRLGNLQIKSSQTNSCNNETDFGHFVLSEYLKSVITNSIQNSLTNRLANNPVIINC